MTRMLMTAVVAAWLGACGGAVESDTGSDDSTGDPGPDVSVDLPADAVFDSSPDTATDTEEDTVPGCVTHQDCLPDMFCGPCLYTRCPCDPEIDWDCHPRCEENPCWDGSSADCTDVNCPVYEVLTIMEGMCRCVRIDVCRGWGDPGCLNDGHCPPAYYCDPCAHGSCPDCDDCVQDCAYHGCPTEPELTCTEPRPDCGEGNTSVIDAGCWVCVSLEDCTPV
jgi:hypothetical protein